MTGQLQHLVSLHWAARSRDWRSQEWSSLSPWPFKQSGGSEGSPHLSHLMIWFRRHDCITIRSSSTDEWELLWAHLLTVKHPIGLVLQGFSSYPSSSRRPGSYPRSGTSTRCSPTLDSLAWLSSRRFPCSFSKAASRSPTCLYCRLHWCILVAWGEGDSPPPWLWAGLRQAHSKWTSIA